MNAVIEVEVNSCFPLMSDGKNTLRQDAYPLPNPISGLEGGLPSMKDYIETAFELADKTTPFWKLADVREFAKVDCNTSFSSLITQITNRLTSPYITGVPGLVAPDADINPDNGGIVEPTSGSCRASEWVNMFDYEFHNACPFKWQGKKVWHCMGRLNEDGLLQFAFMHEFPANDSGCTGYALSNPGLDGECVALGKDVDGLSLLLANKEESQHFMLDKEGKLKKAVNPVLLGVISNEQPVTCIENANSSINGCTLLDSQGNIIVDKSRIPKLFTSEWNINGTATWEEFVEVSNPAVQMVTTTSMLGFVYTIWGTIYKNVLYMVALKLPLPGSASYLVKGTYQGNPTWYRLQTGADDLITDINEAMPASKQHQPAITAADLVDAYGASTTETFKLLVDIGLVDIDQFELVDDLAQFAPLIYKKFNVERYMDLYGSDEPLEDEIQLATVSMDSPYDQGLKLDWQGDIFMNTSLIGNAGFLSVKTDNGYEDLPFSYYSPKSMAYRYCSGAQNDPSGDMSHIEPLYNAGEEVTAMNMLLFTYSGLFSVGDPADELQVIPELITGVAHLISGAKQPSYIPGGFFKRPSTPCLMGANELCTNSVDCSAAYANGQIQQQQCGGPFDQYRIGNPKALGSNPIFDCDGKFLMFANIDNASPQILQHWKNPGLLHAGGACGLDPTTQPNIVPHLKYTNGSRPLLVGGSVVGGVNYICASVQKIGVNYSILFYQGQAYNGWNSFYARVDEDLTGVVASKADPTVRGDLGLAPRDGNFAFEFNNYVYNPPTPPTMDWTASIVGFAPNPAGNAEDSGGPGVHVFVHSVDECGFPEIYKIVCKASKMYQLYNSLHKNVLHADLFSYGFSRGLGKGQVTAAGYNAVTMHADTFTQLDIVDSNGFVVGCDRTISAQLYGVRRGDREWEAIDFPVTYHKITGINTLNWEIDKDAYKDQVFYVSARANTFKGACNCISIKEEANYAPSYTPPAVRVPWADNPNQYVEVKARQWFYLHINGTQFVNNMKQYTAEVIKETKAKRTGITMFAQASNIVSWYVTKTAALYNMEYTGNEGWVSEENGKMTFNIYHTPTPVYMTAIVNWRNRPLDKTGFELWMYDENTREDVTALMEEDWYNSGSELDVPPLVLPPILDGDDNEFTLPEIDIELPEFEDPNLEIL